MRRELTAVLITVSCLSACGTMQDRNSKSEIRNPKQIPNSKSETPNSELEARIQLLIKQLGDNKPQVREDATNGLINIGKPAEPFVKDALSIKDAEVVWRAKLILKALAVKERVKFSDGLLKWYPTIYRELANDDAVKRPRVLQKVTETNENAEPIHDVTYDDIVGVIGEVLLDGGKGLSDEEKGFIDNAWLLLELQKSKMKSEK